jgi:predicted kinase
MTQRKLSMTIELLIGPLASGKSTYCRQAATEGAIIVNDDAIVTAVHGGDYTLYKKSLKPLYKNIENSIIGTALSMGLRVVVDRPNHSIQMRNRYVALGNSFDVPVDFIMFKREPPNIHAERRFVNDARGHSLQYWIEVAMAHDSLYEKPCESLENFNNIYFWNFDNQQLIDWNN